MDAVKHSRLAFLEWFEETEISRGDSLSDIIPRFFRARGDIFQREDLATERFRQFKRGLITDCFFSREFADRSATQSNRVNRFAADTIQQQCVSHLTHSSDDIHPFSFAFNCE